MQKQEIMPCLIDPRQDCTPGCALFLDAKDQYEQFQALMGEDDALNTLRQEIQTYERSEVALFIGLQINGLEEKGMLESCGQFERVLLDNSK